MSTRDRQVRSGPRLAFVLVGLALVFPVFVYLVYLFGHVVGEEFCPRNFQRRNFSYYEIPLFGIQISPIWRMDVTGDLEDELSQKKWIDTSAPEGLAPLRWDLVEAHRGGSRVSFGDAQILCNYLDAVDGDGKQAWLEWSQQHAELAEVLWPLVAQLARDELYVLMPPLLAAAWDADDAAVLQQQLDEILAERCLELADAYQQLQRNAAAIELYTLALRHAPGSTAALEGRSRAYLSSGDASRSAADRAAAEQLQ